MKLGLASMATLERGENKAAFRVYENRITPIEDPKNVLSGHLGFLEPVRALQRFEAPILA